jgi:signal transduction histidine kinase
VKVLHLSILVLTYALAIAFFPSLSRGQVTYAYFTETYFGCIGACIVLSLVALFARPGMLLYVVLFFRFYLVLVLGYGIGGFLSTKLVLGIGLVTEVAVLVEFPASLAIEGIVIAIMAATQVWPVFFGASGLVEAPAAPSCDELTVLCLVLAFSAVSVVAIVRMSARRKELIDIIRIHEANLDALAELNLNLQGYARTVDEESSERERNRISREIHDISGYIFTNLIALMDAAGSMRRDDQAGLTDILITARKTAQEGLRETRVALRKLRDEQPAMVNSPRAIYKIVSIFRKIAGIEVELSLGNMPHALSQDLNLALYRTVQEALTNAVRHGKSTRVRVNFWVADGDLLLTITDNGKGADEIVKGIGLKGMEERIGALGGTISTGRATEGGFSLSLRVPLSTSPEDR